MRSTIDHLRRLAIKRATSITFKDDDGELNTVSFKLTRNSLSSWLGVWHADTLVAEMSVAELSAAISIRVQVRPLASREWTYETYTHMLPPHNQLHKVRRTLLRTVRPDLPEEAYQL